MSRHFVLHCTNDRTERLFAVSSCLPVRPHRLIDSRCESLALNIMHQQQDLPFWATPMQSVSVEAHSTVCCWCCSLQNTTGGGYHTIIVIAPCAHVDNDKFTWCVWWCVHAYNGAIDDDGSEQCASAVVTVVAGGNRSNHFTSIYFY